MSVDVDVAITDREYFLAYWLLRAYTAMGRVGWEEGPSAEETRSELCDVLANMGLDPNLSEEAQFLLATCPGFSIPVPR